jgi:hypothetical protein
MRQYGVLYAHTSICREFESPQPLPVVFPEENPKQLDQVEIIENLHQAKA